jgi:hypothetical protein
MFGPGIVVRSISVPHTRDQAGNEWQYHSRSDRHSKIICWAILFDLLRTCALLREHVEQGKVVFGINHSMHDFRQNRDKNFDLVVCTPRSLAPGEKASQARFRGLVREYGVALTPGERGALDTLPDVPVAPVGSVQIALEAKAAMTSHIKARPRLYDELNSSHQTIHGNADLAIAVGFVMVNIADTFVSSDINKYDRKQYPTRVSKHSQPKDALRVAEKVLEVPRRSKVGDEGFDAIALVVVDCANDGSAVKLVEDREPAPKPGGTLHYETMIRRVAQLYESRFPRV